MTRSSRQEGIPAWHQDHFANACVAVYGGDWLALYVVWALNLLGVGNTLWVGKPRRGTDRIASSLLSDPPRFPGSMTYDYPFEAESGHELAWALGNQSIDVLVVCAEDRPSWSICVNYARQQKLRWVSGVGAHGGYVSYDRPPRFGRARSNPIVSLAVAAQLVDAVREILCPLADGMLPPEGPLGWKVPSDRRRFDAVLVGVGGIGTFAALALGSLAQQQSGPATSSLHLVDHDVVEETNLNRQALFSLGDVDTRAPKSLAARATMEDWFGQLALSAEVCRVDRCYRPNGAAKQAGQTLISAVDNAATRLSLQRLGHELAMPVVQGGTDTFAADCFTQLPGGPLLDEQMNGALSEAAQRETRPRRRGGCAGDPSYVVPSMMAGALVAYRALQARRARKALPPIRWRSGDAPVEERKTRVFDLCRVAL